MRYIHLNSDSYIIHLSTGLVTLTTKSFNFHKIKKLIEAKASEEELLPLLVIPEMPNGLYEAYLYPNKQQMAYLHVALDGDKTLYGLQKNQQITITDKVKKELNENFIGVYASLESLIDDWPEYLL